MADNSSIASDDIGGIIYQRVKQTLGQDGTATADAGGRNLGAAVGGAAYVDLRQSIVSVAVTPTISTTIYAAGDAVGGLLTFANAARTTGFPIRITDVVIIDRDQELAPFDLVLFDRTFTATADNAVFAPSDADMANCVGVIEIVANDYHNFSTNAVAHWPETTAGNRGLSVVLNGTDLFGQLVARSTPTYTATSDLTVKVIVEQF